MAETTTADEPTRRDFLFIATGAMGAVAAGFVAWPLIDQMSPDATTLAAASTEVDIANIPEGQIITVKWRGKPIFISHRTPKEVEEARAVALNELRDPAVFRDGGNAWLLYTVAGEHGIGLARLNYEEAGQTTQSTP